MRNILLSHLTAKFRTGVSFGRWRAISRRLSRDDMRKQKWQEYPLSSPWLRVLTRPLFFSCFSWKGEILVKSPTTPPKKGAWAAKVCQSYMRASHNQKSNGSPFLSLSRRNRKDKWREKKKRIFYEAFTSCYVKYLQPVTFNENLIFFVGRVWINTPNIRCANNTVYLKKQIAYFVIRHFGRFMRWSYFTNNSFPHLICYFCKRSAERRYQRREIVRIKERF